MSLCAIVPVASMAAANTTLQTAGFGPRNFSVPGFGASGLATHAALHAWDDSAFSAAVKAIAGVVWNEAAGDPVSRTKTLIEAQGAQWGAQLPVLPASGNVAKNSMWRWGDDILIVIQAFNRTTNPNDPYTYPALLARVHEPGERRQWKQPQYAFDAYKLVNPFNGKPDECLHGGKAWRVLQGDGSGNNVWTPGEFGWGEIASDGSTLPEPVNEWPEFVQPTGAHDAYAIGAKITFNGKHYTSKIAANTYSPTAYPAGWQLQP